MLKLVKTVHTIIWVIMTVSNFMAFYFAYIGQFDLWFWLPASLIFLEIIIILTNNWKCPVTTVAEKYTENRKPNFDIYLPEWLAKYNVRIYTVLIIVEIIVVLVKRFF